MRPRNFSPHHTVTTFKIGEWHYNCVLEDNLDDCFADPSRCGVDVQSIVDGLLGRFGAGGLAHMQRRTVGASEGGGDAPLSFEDAAQRRPTGILTALTQARADHLHELIGDHGDEQMPFGEVAPSIRTVRRLTQGVFQFFSGRQNPLESIFLSMLLCLWGCGQGAERLVHQIHRHLASAVGFGSTKICGVKRRWQARSGIGFTGSLTRTSP